MASVQASIPVHPPIVCQDSQGNELHGLALVAALDAKVYLSQEAE